MPSGHVNITVTTATSPPLLTAPPNFDISSQSDMSVLPGVGSVHRQARLTEEARRQGEAAAKIQALFRGYRVRCNLATSLGRVGDGEEDGTRTNGVMKSASNSILKTNVLNCNGVLKTTAPDVSLKPAVPSQSVAVQTSTSLLHLKPTTSQPPTKVAMPPWQKGGGDPLSVINIFTRERSHLHQTLSSLKTQKLSELRQLKSSTPRPQDHTHSNEQGSSMEDVPSNYSYSLSFPSLHSSTHSVAGSTHSAECSSSAHSAAGSTHSAAGSTHSVSTHLNESPNTKTHSSYTVTPSPVSHSSHTHSTPPPTTNTTTDEEIPAITPPGSPSFVSSFTASSRLPQVDKTTSVTSTDPHRGSSSGGRLSPRSLGLKLQAELTLLETIEESMGQLSAVEGSRAVSNARQESLSLAELVEKQRREREREKSAADSRAKEVEEERKKEEKTARAREAEAQRAREEVERREKERAAAAEADLAQQRREISQQLAEARAATSAAVISSARLQVEAAHTMAVSVATAAAKEAVSAAMVGVALTLPHTPPKNSTPLPRTPPDSTPNEPPIYSTDFEGSVQPDSLTEEIDTEHSLLVPTTGGAAGNSSGESTLTPGDSEGAGGGGGGGGDDSQATIPEEVDGSSDLRHEV